MNAGEEQKEEEKRTGRTLVSVAASSRAPRGWIGEKKKKTENKNKWTWLTALDGEDGDVVHRVHLSV